MLRRIIAKLRGTRGHAGVDKIVGRYVKDVAALDAAHDSMGHEIRSNADQQVTLEIRNTTLRQQRERAAKVRSKLSEIVS